MVPRENKNNTYAKFWRENKEYYGIFESGPFNVQPYGIFNKLKVRGGLDHVAGKSGANELN